METVLRVQVVRGLCPSAGVLVVVVVVCRGSGRVVVAVEVSEGLIVLSIGSQQLLLLKGVVIVV